MRKADIKAKARKAQRIARQRAQVQKVLESHYSVFEPESCKHGVQLYSSKLEKVGCSALLAEQMGKISTKWSFSMYLLTREKNGKNKLITECYDIDTPCKHSDINEQMADIQIDFCKSYQWQENILTTAWIVTAKGFEPSESQAYEIFNDLGCWSDLIAEWESNEQQSRRTINV